MPNYQTTLFELEQGQRDVKPAGPDRVEMSAATLETARYDVQTIDLTHGSVTHGNATRDEGARAAARHFSWS